MVTLSKTTPINADEIKPTHESDYLSNLSNSVTVTKLPGK